MTYEISVRYDHVTFYYPGGNRGMKAIPVVLLVAMARTMPHEPPAGFIP